MLEKVKFCKTCGKLISDLDREGTDYYRHLPLQYCPECRELSDHLHGAARLQRYRERQRQRNKERDEQLQLLKEENELLRQRIAELRRH